MDHEIDFEEFEIERHVFFGPLRVHRAHVHFFRENSLSVMSRAVEEKKPIVCRCIQSGYVKTAKALVERGFSLSDADSDGTTPLHLSAMQRCEELVKFLISKGADVNAKDKMGRTALHLAGCISNRDAAGVVKALCDGNANLDAPDNDGQTPLMRASSYGKIDIAAYLIELGASVNIHDRHGNSALVHSMSYNPSPALIDMLLDKGAQADVEDLPGFAPLVSFLNYVLVRSVAYDGKDNDNCKIVKSLIAAGCNVNKMNSLGELSLCVAASAKQTELMKILLNSGCSTSLEDGISRTALFYACQSGHEASVRLILAAGIDKVVEASWLLHREYLEDITDKNLIKICLEKVSGVPKLGEICRTVIRGAVAPNIESRVGQLNYPIVLKNFLLLNHY